MATLGRIFGGLIGGGAPRDANAWYKEGNKLAALGRYEEAIGCYDHALAMDGRCAVAWNDKGNSLHCLSRFEEAVGCYDQALAADPQTAYFWYNKALFAQAGIENPPARGRTRSADGSCSLVSAVHRACAARAPAAVCPRPPAHTGTGRDVALPADPRAAGRAVTAMVISVVAAVDGHGFLR